MSINKIIIIFGLLLITFGAVVFYQFNSRSAMKPTGKVTIGTRSFNVEVVRDSKAQQIGLTKYEKINDDQGMFFIFDTPGTHGFWMKNMKFSIDIIFINNNKIVSIVQDAKPMSNNEEPEIYTPEAPIDNVLEIKSGLSKRYNFKKGDDVKIEIE